MAAASLIPLILFIMFLPYPLPQQPNNKISLTAKDTLVYLKR